MFINNRLSVRLALNLQQCRVFLTAAVPLHISAVRSSDMTRTILSPPEIAHRSHVLLRLLKRTREASRTQEASV